MSSPSDATPPSDLILYETEDGKAIYEEAELVDSSTCKQFLQVRSELKREDKNQVSHSSHQVIPPLGFPVRSSWPAKPATPPNTDGNWG